VVSGNTIFSSNYDGIYLYSSSNNVVSSNILLHNDFNGISLYYSSSNVVCGNTISSNYYGIYLAFLSSNNTIYHNNFNNTDQAWSESKNFWNYGDEGNYWSDYTRQDLNKDGIGDAPYAIDVVNKDNYPLMGTFYEFSITLGREIYSVTIISNSTISLFRFQIGAETGNKMIHFNATGEDGTLGFCRVKMTTRLMNYPYIVLVDSEEIIPTVLNVSNEAYAYLYFTYLHKNHTITIISSKTLALYFELLGNYTQLQITFGELNNSYQKLYGLNRTYYELLDNYLKLQMDLHDLNDSYLEHLLDYSEQMQNIRNLTYILVALTAIFIITSIYLSKRAHARITTKSKEFEGE
jgi:parallel beta-helix repeat protein